MSRPRSALLLAFAALLPPPAAPAAAESSDVLAVKARAVLYKNCAACHDGTAAPHPLTYTPLPDGRGTRTHQQVSYRWQVFRRSLTGAECRSPP